MKIGTFKIQGFPQIAPKQNDFSDAKYLTPMKWV